MKVSLTSWLARKGVQKEEDLTPEEQVTLDSYKRILAGEVTVESLKAFCHSQVRIIESACDGVKPLTPIQQAALHVYLTLLRAIEAPEAEKEALERKLQQELL